MCVTILSLYSPSYSCDILSHFAMLTSFFYPYYIRVIVKKSMSNLWWKSYLTFTSKWKIYRCFFKLKYVGYWHRPVEALSALKKPYAYLFLAMHHTLPVVIQFIQYFNFLVSSIQDSNTLVCVINVWGQKQRDF